MSDIPTREESPMLPWSAELAGRLHERTLTSELLRAIRSAIHTSARCGSTRRRATTTTPSGDTRRV